MNYIMTTPGTITTESKRFKQFTFTVKALGSDIDPDYTPFLKHLEKLKIKVLYQYGERDSLNKFHWHGLLELPNGYYRKRLIQKGFNLHLREFYAGDEWLTYCKKSQNTQKVYKKMF